MAKKKNYPVVRHGRLDTAASTSGEVLVPIDQFLSKTNRRLYRQARNYRVKIDVDPGSSQRYQVFALANSWMNHQALKMAYDMYLKNSADERERLGGSTVARWEDFRVSTGSTATVARPVQFDVNFLATALTLGDFALTTVVDGNNVPKNFSWTPTGSAGRYSILEEYDKAGNASLSPTTSTGDIPYDNLMSDNDATMANALQTIGETPPYDAEGVHAPNPWVMVGEIGASGNIQRLSTGFFDAPCGFVLLYPLPGTADQLADLSWEVQAGDYKGVKAPSMLE
jgi:hypothetical protein